MELLRSLAGGGERLDYLGYSYGTMLGATYATLFPEKAGRMVLDSAENAQWGALTHNYDQMVAVSKAVSALAERCSDLTTSEGAAVTCPFTSEREMLDYQKSLTDKPLVASDGTEITDEVLAEFTEFDCAVLPATGTDITTSFDASKVSSVLLVIGITGDHATPYQHGKELARQLGKASFVTLEGTGHGASFSGRSTCIDELATAYLVDGTVPKDGTVCQPDVPEAYS